MSSRKSCQQGFTLIELMVVIAVAAIITISFSVFFNNYLNFYARYQRDSTNFTALARQSQRVANVLRGVTDITSADNNDLVAYAYFSPGDVYVSQIHYYLNASATALMADVTPMTANPPTGALITSKLKTYTIISDYYQDPGSSLFTYYDISGTAMALPISDEHSIQSIKVSLASPASYNSKGQNLNVTVSLRNRKTNL